MLSRLAVLATLVILTIPVLQSRVAAFDPGKPGGSMAEYEAFDPPREMPEIQFVDENGRELTLADFRGRVVLLNLWATWCAPCIREMPDLDALAGARDGPNFTVLALSLDRKGVPQVKSFYEQHGIEHLGIYVDKDMKSFRSFPTPVLPSTFIIGRDGRALGGLVGAADWSSAEALALVDHYLGTSDGNTPQQAAAVPTGKKSRVPQSTAAVGSL
jgi:thiol-disulfide isomerase/thioredoxin